MTTNENTTDTDNRWDIAISDADGTLRQIIKANWRRWGEEDDAELIEALTDATSAIDPESGKFDHSFADKIDRELIARTARLSWVRA